MSTNNIYYVDMEERFREYQSGEINLYTNHEMVYEMNNVSLALNQLGKSSGKMALGQDGTNYKTFERYSIYQLSKIVKQRLIKKQMNYVRRIYIDKGRKKNGEKRPLGICSIWDKLVEKCIQLVIEPYCETKFVDSSFGFREQVSTHNALAKVKNQCQTMPYVLSIDLKNYFGSISPDIAYRELWHIGIRDQVILNYIYQYIKKGYYEDGCKINDPLGTAQGSILGPLISNIYLHRFDVWLRDQGDCWHDKNEKRFHDSRNKRKNLENSNLKVGIHVRYADDILVLCKAKEDAERFQHSIRKYLTRNMKLTINEEKTRIYDLKMEGMKYLGYRFRVSKQNRKKSQKRYQVNNMISKEKADELVEKAKRLLKSIKKTTSMSTLHEWNIYVIGIHNYYKGMNHFYQSFNQIGWRIYKQFYHTMNKRVEFIKEQTYKNNFMRGRYRTWGTTGYYCYKNYPVIQIGWANWDQGLIHAVKGKVTRENPYAYGKKKHKPGVGMEEIDYLVKTSGYIKNSRLAIFRVSKYSSSKGISLISGNYVPVEEYNCYHIIPESKGGGNEFGNLCVLSESEAVILQGKNPEELYQLYPRRKVKIKKLIENL